MRTLTYAVAAAVMLALSACGGGDSPNLAVGTGTGTLVVQADITSESSLQNSRDPLQFTTTYVVRVWKAYPTGQLPLASAVVKLNVGSRQVALMNDAANGHPERYIGTEIGVVPDDVVTLNVDAPNGSGGTDYVHGVSRRAPGLHYFTSPDGTAPIPVALPLTVNWSRPVQADFAHLHLGNFDSDLAVDSGSTVLPANTLQPDSTAPCSLNRTNSVEIAGAYPKSGSSLDIHVNQGFDSLNLY